jgi:hypothetical protein
MDLGLVFRKSKDSGGSVLVGYADASFSGEATNSRSTTGWVFQVNGAAVSWTSKVQDCVALSTAEAEYIAAASAAQEAVYLRQVLECSGTSAEGANCRL